MEPLPVCVLRPASRSLVIAALALAGCRGQISPVVTPATEAAVIQLGSSSAALPLAQDLTSRYALVNPALHFELQAGSYATVAAMAQRAQPAWFLTNWLPGAAESDLWAAPLGHDAIVIIAHPELPVSNLTLEQLRALFQGRGAEAGLAAGQSLHIISREAGSGTRAAFVRLVMGERRTSPAAIVVHSSAAMRASVARQPGAIGYLAASWLDNSVQALRIEGIVPGAQSFADRSWPLRTTLFIAGAGEPQDERLRSFIAWAQGPDGQSVLAQRHVPLRYGE